MSRSVLIVDDEPALRILFGKRLANAGFEVFYAENGVDGLELIEQLHPSVIILDYDMPIMDGATMLQELRRHPDLGATPVIFITATSVTSVPGIRQADIILSKPANTIELVSIVSRLAD